MDDPDRVFGEIKNLEWHRSKEDQLAAIERLAEEIGDDISLLMFSNLNKSQWENSALVLSRLERKKLAKYHAELLCWLQDMNWPGASLILDILKSVPSKELLKKINSSIEQARGQNDYEWLDALLSLKRELT